MPRPAILFLRHHHRRTRNNNIPPFISRPGPYIDDPIALRNDIHIMFNDDHGIARIHQPVELSNQPPDIDRM